MTQPCTGECQDWVPIVFDSYVSVQEEEEEVEEEEAEGEEGKEEGEEEVKFN